MPYDPGVLESALIALFAGSISLLFVLSARNVAISDRMRKCTEAVRDLTEPSDAARRSCLLEQARLFYDRYPDNLRAVLLVLFAIILLVVTAMAALFGFHKPAAVLIVLAASSLILALLSAGRDYFRSAKTLKLEYDNVCGRHAAQAAGESCSI